MDFVPKFSRILKKTGKSGEIKKNSGNFILPVINFFWIPQIWKPGSGQSPDWDCEGRNG